MGGKIIIINTASNHLSTSGENAELTLHRSKMEHEQHRKCMSVQLSHQAPSPPTTPPPPRTTDVVDKVVRLWCAFGEKPGA